MLEQVISEALAKNKEIADVDEGGAELALTYARAIDGRHKPCAECDCPGTHDLPRLGPALLACLEALMMSPRVRAVAKKAVTNAKPATQPLDELAKRRAGLSRPAGVDAAAT